MQAEGLGERSRRVPSRVDHAGLMRHDGAVYVQKDSATIMEILRVNHDDPRQGGHFGRTKTEHVIRRFYWWPGLEKSVRKYVATCDVCQRMKVPRYKPYGLLVPLPQPDRPWQDILLDFIVECVDDELELLRFVAGASESYRLYEFPSLVATRVARYVYTLLFHV